MANFILSAFADEIDSNFDIQLESLKKLGINMLELRGVNGKSFVELSDEEAYEVKQKLSENKISLSALGSPIGKIKVDGDFIAHKNLLERIMDIGDILECKRIRMFSFYPAENMSRDAFRVKAFSMLDELLAMAEKRGFLLCHENEKDIFGETPEQELELLEHFGGRLKAVLDPGNFAFCLLDASKVYPLLKKNIEYFHINDADESGAIVPPGKGVAFLKETLAGIAADRPDEDVILTIEPHLMGFVGLASLSKLDDIRHVYSFDTPFDAFKTAVDAVKGMISDL